MPAQPQNNSDKLDFIIGQLQLLDVLVKGQKESAKRLDRIEGRMDRFEERLNRIEERMDRFEERLDRIEERMDRFEERLDRIEERMDRFEEQLQGFRETIEQIRTLIVEVGEHNSRKVDKLREEILHEISLITAKHNTDNEVFQQQNKVLNASIDHLESEVNKLNKSDANQNNKLSELDSRVAQIEVDASEK